MSQDQESLTGKCARLRRDAEAKELLATADAAEARYDAATTMQDQRAALRAQIAALTKLANLTGSATYRSLAHMAVRILELNSDKYGIKPSEVAALRADIADLQ